MKNVFVIILNLLLFSLLNATIRVVDDDGSADFTNIQDAIMASMHGDTVFVKNGTYSIFSVPSVKITIIGESNDSTMIVGRQGGGIWSTEDCEINNLRFTGDLLLALYIPIYGSYWQYHAMPKIIIQNCVFDARPNAKPYGIAIDIAYHHLLEDDVSLLDSLSKQIIIVNNTFNGIYGCLAMALGGILGKRTTSIHTTDVPLIYFECRDNYYTVTDSIGIDTLVIDYRDPPPEVQPGDANRAFFNYSPWSDTLITMHTNNIYGIRYNNFINCRWAFYSSLWYDTSYSKIPNVSIPDQFEIVKAYPNPFNNTSVIEFFLLNRSNIDIRIFNASGQELSELHLNRDFPAGLNNYKLNFSHYASGVYFLTLKKNDILLDRKKLLLLR